MSFFGVKGVNKIDVHLEPQYLEGIQSSSSSDLPFDRSYIIFINRLKFIN